jgi:hypothetical protein
MMIVLFCFAMGLAIAVGQNIPEIRDTIHDRHGHPYIGTASYLATTSLSYGLILWLIAMAMLCMTDLAQ